MAEHIRGWQESAMWDFTGEDPDAVLHTFAARAKTLQPEKFTEREKAELAWAFQHSSEIRSYQTDRPTTIDFVRHAAGELTEQKGVRLTSEERKQWEEKITSLADHIQYLCEQYAAIKVATVRAKQRMSKKDAEDPSAVFRGAWEDRERTHNQLLLACRDYNSTLEQLEKKHGARFPHFMKFSTELLDNRDVLADWAAETDFYSKIREIADEGNISLFAEAAA